MYDMTVYFSISGFVVVVRVDLGFVVAEQTTIMY